MCQIHICTEIPFCKVTTFFHLVARPTPMSNSYESSSFWIAWLVSMVRRLHGYGFFVGAWLARVRVIDVVEVRLIELCWPSCSSRYPEYRCGWFMFFDQLCWLVNMLGTIIRSLVRCVAPCVGFRRWMVILPILEINGLGRLISTLPLTLWCVGRIASVVSDSRYGNFAFFDVSSL